MSDFFPPMLAEWQTIIHAVWPEITLPGAGADSNFFTSLQLMQRNILSIVNQATPALPYVCLGIGSFPATSLTLDRSDRQAHIVLFYMDSDKNGATQTTINAKLQAAEAYIRTRLNSYFCIIEDGSIESSDFSAVNEGMRGISGINVFGGELTYPNCYAMSKA